MARNAFRDFDEYLLLMRECRDFKTLHMYCEEFQTLLHRPMKIPKQRPIVTSFDIDRLAVNCLPFSHCAMRPLQIRGDGSCLFHAVSILLCGTERLSKELRVRCMIDMVLNIDHYLANNNVRLCMMAENSIQRNLKQDVEYETFEKCYVSIWVNRMMTIK